MRVTTHATLAAALLLSAASAFAFNLGDAAKAVAGASQGDSAQVATTPQTSGLLGALTGQLGVSQEQAVGGTGALLGLAKNQLAGNDYSQLVKTIPGLDKLAGNNALAGPRRARQRARQERRRQQGPRFAARQCGQHGRREQGLRHPGHG